MPVEAVPEPLPEKLLPCSPHDQEVSSGNGSPSSQSTPQLHSMALAILLLVCDQ